MSHDRPADTVHLFGAKCQQEFGQDHPASGAGRCAAADRSLRVLIVDDEQEAADSLCVIVRSWGHDARRVYDGASGLTLAADHLPNVVLLDIAMPEMDGYALAQQLRCRPSLKGCFLVAMRASRDERDSQRRKEADIDLFLAKPMDLATLETLLLMEGERLDRLEARK